MRFRLGMLIINRSPEAAEALYFDDNLRLRAVMTDSK